MGAALQSKQTILKKTRECNKFI